MPIRSPRRLAAARDWRSRQQHGPPTKPGDSLWPAPTGITFGLSPKLGKSGSGGWAADGWRRGGGWFFGGSGARFGVSRGLVRGVPEGVWRVIGGVAALLRSIGGGGVGASQVHVERLFAGFCGEWQVFSGNCEGNCARLDTPKAPARKSSRRFAYLFRFTAALWGVARRGPG